MLGLALSACSDDDGSADGGSDGGGSGDGASASASASAGGELVLPPTDTRFDYQLGGVRDVPDDVGVVARDRTAEPLEGVYNICYVNGFQTQPDEEERWQGGDLLLSDADGELVIDEQWDEVLLDIGTPQKRDELAGIVGEWIAGCADDGFDAVEIDNLDSYTRSDDLLDLDDAEAFAELLTAAAHDAGLAIGQKNLAEWDGSQVGFDFAVSEACAEFDECGAYVDYYDGVVLDIEYDDESFAAACDEWGDEFPVVRRDLDLAVDGERAWCD